MPIVRGPAESGACGSVLRTPPDPHTTTFRTESTWGALTRCLAALGGISVAPLQRLIHLRRAACPQGLKLKCSSHLEISFKLAADALSIPISESLCTPILRTALRRSLDFGLVCPHTTYSLVARIWITRIAIHSQIAKKTIHFLH